MNLIRALGRGLARVGNFFRVIELTLHLRGGQRHVVRCKSYNAKFNPVTQRLTNLSVTKSRGFPAHLVLNDVSMLTVRVVLI